MPPNLFYLYLKSICFIYFMTMKGKGIHFDTRRQSYVYTRRQNLCRCKLLEEIYVTKYIKI